MQPLHVTTNYGLKLTPFSSLGFLNSVVIVAWKKKELKKWISFKYDHLLRTTFLVQPVFEPHASQMAKQQLYYFGITLGFWETAHLPLP